eukprot:TRINITY_DN48926_c0_g1_i1.p1 TRINITY_DN48926_c0_g1~~TRINITY_DN48926_c0_g1_i1.p1  ORF type:complete len:438 (-),score=36.62 TRINITY_DN48926_c0_g1_i1:278-1519(-)
MVRMSYAGLAGARDYSKELHCEAARARTVRRLRRESEFQIARVNEPGLYESTPKDKDEDSEAYLQRLGFIEETAPPLLYISVVGHEEEILHGEGSLPCTLYEIHCQLCPVGVTPWAEDEISFRLTTQWRCKRRLCDIRSNLYDKVKRKLSGGYPGWFRKTPFARRGGIRGTTGRLRAWFSTFAEYFNTVMLDKRTKVQWLRFVGAPGKPRQSRTFSSVGGSGYTSAASSARPSLTSRTNVLISRGVSPYGSRQVSRQNTQTFSQASSRALSRASSSGSLSTDKASRSNAPSSSAGPAGYTIGAASHQPSSSRSSPGYGTPSSRPMQADEIMNAMAGMDLNCHTNHRSSSSRLPELREEAEEMQDVPAGHHCLEAGIVAENEGADDATGGESHGSMLDTHSGNGSEGGAVRVLL